MNKKPLIITVMVSALLISMLFSIQSLNGQSKYPQITISEDGSVIGTDRIQQRGNTYTLTGNLNASIIIEKDNIVLNGAGFTLQGSGIFTTVNETAISLTNRNNVIIENLNITGFNTDIALYNSSKCTISSNKIYGNNNQGVYIDNSWNIWVKQNDVENTVLYGIDLYFTNSSLISDNRVVNNLGTGIDVENYGAESNNIISGNTLQNNMLSTGGFGDIGIDSSNNTIIGNNITNSSGIDLGLNNASGNIFTQNSISKCGIALFVVGYNNTFFENNIIGNNASVECWAIVQDDMFYLNNFINNTQIDTQASMYSNPSSPNWDNGAQGNYYSDYLTKYPTAKEVDSTGTYETPYAITEQTTYVVHTTYLFYDYHPLINPVNIFQNVTELPFWITPSPKLAPINQVVQTSYIVVVVIAAVILACVIVIVVKRHLVVNSHFRFIKN